MTFTTDNPLATSLAADPFTSLAVHYGMLLGVGDFEVLAANPRGKLRIHQAWQHGPGVIWGYEPTVVPESLLLQVSPGLAVDGVGRECASSSDQCLDVGKWLAEHPDVHPVVSGDTASFPAELVLRHRACLARPVPAMSSTCQGSARDTEYSRILETAELELRPRSVSTAEQPDLADARDHAFEQLRALVREGEGATGDDWLQAFREIAATETMALAPPAFRATTAAGSRLFPESEPGEILLAHLELQIDSSGPTPVLAAPTLDVSVRRSHLPTWLIEELIAESLRGRGGPAADAGGPRVSSIEVAGTTVTVTLTGEVVSGTIEAAFELATLDVSGGPATASWSSVPLAFPADLTYQAGPPATITFDLPAPPDPEVTHRLVIRGTGIAPLVGLVDGVPVALGGREGGPPAGPADGHDVIELFLP